MPSRPHDGPVPGGVNLDLEGQLPGLDSKAPRPSFGKGPVTLRWVMVHMLEETACHVGHLDLLTDPWSAE